MFYTLFFQKFFFTRPPLEKNVYGLKVWAKMRGLRWAVNIAAWEPTELECCRSFATIQGADSNRSTSCRRNILLIKA